MKSSGVMEHVTVYIPDVKEDQAKEEPGELKPPNWYERLSERLQLKEKKPEAKLVLFN